MTMQMQAPEDLSGKVPTAIGKKSDAPEQFAAETLAWLDALYSRCTPDDGELLFVAASKKKLENTGLVSDLPAAAKKISGKTGLYLKINLMDLDAIKERSTRDRKGLFIVGGKSEVKTIVSFHLDVDAGKSDKYLSREDALAALDAMPHPPTLVVNSDGDEGGFHAYWILKKPHRIADDKDRSRINGLTKRWEQRLSKLTDGKLDSTANIDRVLRVVGGLRQNGNMVSVHSYEPDRLYSLDELTIPAAENEVATSPSSQTRLDIIAGNQMRCQLYVDKMGGAIAGKNGSNKTIEVGSTIARFALDESLGWPVIQSFNLRCVPPWDESDLRRKMTEGIRLATEAGEFGKFDRELVTPPEVASEPYFTFVDAEELDTGNFELSYLVPGIVCERQPLVIAGQFKSLKTSIGLDLALSLASGTPFLGHFDVPARRKVLVLTAESGMGTVQETCRRICDSHSVSLRDQKDYFTVTDRVPQLNSLSHMGELAGVIDKNKFQVVIADPAYLMLDGDNAGNLFSMGEQLRLFSALAIDAKATPIIIHHARKNNQNAIDYQPLELGDLAWAGFAEFARQWLLLSRQSRYVEGSGEHRLWMSAGGSAGHSGCWGVDAMEGHPSDDGGRKWEVSVNEAKDARSKIANDSQKRRSEKAIEKDQATQKNNREKIISAFRGVRPARLTKKQIAERGGMSGSTTEKAIGYMLRIGELIDGVKIKRQNGREYDGFELIIVEKGSE